MSPRPTPSYSLEDIKAAVGRGRYMITRRAGTDAVRRVCRHRGLAIYTKLQVTSDSRAVVISFKGDERA